MGITLEKLEHLKAAGTLRDKSRVLDIGSSNLYSAEIDKLHQFARSFGRELDAGFAKRIADGSVYGPGITKNESFVGELLEHLGLTYLAFDIAKGYRTQVLNLNAEALPAKLQGAFDTILNFGTTEHVFNQLNSFRVIHDAVKVGGHIVHQVPASGFIDHGYFCYTPRFFFDLAGHNEYEVLDFGYDGPSPGAEIFSIVKDYASYFPALTKSIPQESPRVQDLALNIIVRKTKDLPLRLPMETSTSVVLKDAVEVPRKLLAGLFKHG